MPAASRALELDANLAEAHAAKGGVLATSGDYDAAKPKSTRAATGPRVGRRPPRSRTPLLLSAPLRGRDSSLGKRVALVETDYAIGGLLITCYTTLGDPDGVRRVAKSTLGRAEKALAVDADNGSAMASIFSCLLALGEPERAQDGHVARS